MREFLRSFAIQRRVLGALIMRETWTRFGRENLGFAWMYGEFLIFALPVIVMWHLIRGHREHGLLVVPFVWSGYLPILLFRHMGGHMLHAVGLTFRYFTTATSPRLTRFSPAWRSKSSEIGAQQCSHSFCYTRSAPWSGRAICRCCFSAIST